MMKPIGSSLRYRKLGIKTKKNMTNMYLLHIFFSRKNIFLILYFYTSMVPVIAHSVF